MVIRFLNANIYIILVLFGSTALGNEAANYTAAQKKSVKLFREAVSDLLYLDYHTEDSFLISWLAIANFDLNRARQLLANSIKWRRENGIDSILHDERMIKLENVFPHSAYGSVDKKGHRILILPLGSWDLRKTMLAGNGKDLTRYLDYLFEKVANIPDLVNSTQRGITQAILIIDWSGYSLRQHACLRCFPFFVDFIQHASYYFPYLLKSVIVINTSRAFNGLLQVLRPLFPPFTMEDSLSVYGLNKAEWSQALLRIISPEELPVSLGGTRGQNNTI